MNEPLDVWAVANKNANAPLRSVPRCLIGE